MMRSGFHKRGAAPAVRQPGPTRRRSVSLPILVFASVALLVLSRVNHDLVDRLRWQVMEWMTPVLSAILVPIEPVRRAVRSMTEFTTMSAELERLRAENQQLKGWEWRAKDVERKLQSLSSASNTARETKLEFVTARVVSSSTGAFVRSAMINAGERMKVRDGYPVLSGDGLVGRIVETGPNAARVLLLTDVNSRIPVLVGESAVRAIMSGDNSPSPRLVFTANEAAIKPGDDVRSSGTGGVFPMGLRIGKVAPGGPPFRVATHADTDAVDYLGVLLYDNPALDVIDAARGAVRRDVPASAAESRAAIKIE